MADPNAELLRALGRLVRGLSALFWGLPAALLVCFYTARAEGFRALGIVPPLAATGLLVYGLWQLGAFQPQERIWRAALERSRLLALVLFGLSPFLYWWSQLPSHPFYTLMTATLMVGAFLFLASLNLLLQRLGAMLPDETLRLEIRQFTRLNLNLLLTIALLAAVYYALTRFPELPLYFQAVLVVMERGSFWLLVFLVLLPLAMTMALLWKTKEVILESLFHSQP